MLRKMWALMNTRPTTEVISDIMFKFSRKGLYVYNRYVPEYAENLYNRLKKFTRVFDLVKFQYEICFVLEFSIIIINMLTFESHFFFI